MGKYVEVNVKKLNFVLTFKETLREKCPYSVRIQENTDQKQLRIWTLFTQWECLLKFNHQALFEIFNQLLQ